MQATDPLYFTLVLGFQGLGFRIVLGGCWGFKGSGFRDQIATRRVLPSFPVQAIILDINPLILNP